MLIWFLVIVGLIALRLGATEVMKHIEARKPPPLPSKPPGWRIVGMIGVRAQFACGHMSRRAAAFVHSDGRRDMWFRRAFSRMHAEGHACHDCLLKALAGKTPDDAALDSTLKRVEPSSPQD